MKIAAPPSITHEIGQASLRNVREYMTAKRWKSGNALSPISGQGFVGLKTERKYLMYQERGTKPFLMKSLEGRVVPIDGRLVTVKGVGEPGWVHLPGGIRVYRTEKWRHPGIIPKHFMRSSIQRGIYDNRYQLEREVKGVLRGESHHI